MMNDDALVKLAKYCARTCHVLKDVTNGRNMDSLSDPIRNAIEDLGRCVDITRSPLSMITTVIRTMRNIESMINERRNRSHDSGEHRPDSAEDCLMCRIELWETLRILDVCDDQFSARNF